MLDMLETSLKNLITNEPQYRSRELTTEMEEYKKQIKKYEALMKANANDINALRGELEKWNGKETKWEEEKKQMREKWNEDLHIQLKQHEDKCKHGLSEQMTKMKYEIDSLNKQIRSQMNCVACVSMSSLYATHKHRAHGVYAHTNLCVCVCVCVYVRTELEALKQEKSAKEKEAENLRKLDDEHEKIRIRWQEQIKSKDDALEQQLAEIAFLKKSVEEKQQLIQTLQEKSINREMQSEQTQNENTKLTTQLQTLQELPEKMEKITKEKLVLIREIKTLRAQREEMTQQWNEERSKLKLEHLNEIESMRKQTDAEIAIKNEELNRMKLELQQMTEHFERVNQTNSRYFVDVLCKLESFNMTLDNCAIEKLQQTTPGMSEIERREKSNDILRLLLDTIYEALQSEHLDPITSDEFKNNSSSSSSATNNVPSKEICNPHIHKLYRAVLELLCDKAAAIKKENDSFISTYYEVLFPSIIHNESSHPTFKHIIKYTKKHIRGCVCSIFV
ncbi:hypothetical protein RFI_20931 [Reticulomyxa filosa]|uniref:Uncharacterized protein n=1 Tax=Reticulomyxa filosa TaxID=46433 RepID=X6MRI9_RETFI|nr:hypothetical protein RFI_20931 [Reticulomyxa filosa]|eukprot:ETO16404.1 hypothetical protein RFI_20931 [Reticulomyxa filosa]